MKIDTVDVQRLIDYYWDNINKLTHQGTMNKIFVLKNWNEGLSDILGKYVPSDPLGDNFYRHNYSYLPHADKRRGPETYNWVIPLETKHPQKFIVFDQKVKHTGKTWVYNLEGDFRSVEPNTAVRCRLCEGDLLDGLTNEPLPDEIYEHVPYFERDFYFGMSGKVYDWIPGEIIKFDSRQVHMTGKMKDDYKLGITLRIAQ